jgi:hypothetical protein
METLEKLAVIKESDFETLVALYMRQRDPQLKGLIQTGINAKGKSIKCQVDGVLYVPSEQPILIHVAVTVFEMGGGLRRKWLGGPQGKKYEVGDIKKAEDEFEKWEKEKNISVSTRKLYLATNRPLENNTDLYSDAVARCEASGIEVEIIEASQLVGFLDHDPEGQYLRQQFLGIDAGRLSESLLREIARSSLIQHQETFGIASQGTRVEIAREAERRLSDVIERSNATLVGVRGASGAGKSTLVRQYGVKIIERGGICLWAPAEDLIRNISTAALLLRILRRFHPSLNEQAGDDALDIAVNIPSGIILLTDDINRLGAPHEALEAARICVQAEVQGRTSEESRARLCFVIPLWPEHLAGQSSTEKANWETVDLGFYTEQERSEFARAHASGQSADLLTLIDLLNGDPFLCGLAVNERSELFTGQSSDQGTLIKNIIEGVLGSAALEAARARLIVATSDEFVGALNQLIELMLRTEQPEPVWSEIRSELGERETALLLALGETNRLGWVEQRPGGSRWRWKHDRLRDALVGRWLAASIVPRLNQTGQAEEDRRLLTLPGVSQGWAWSLAFALPDHGLKLVSALAEHNPLALAESLTIARFHARDMARQMVIEGLRRALDGFNPYQETFVNPPQWPVLHRLTRTDDPIVLEVTECMETNWHVSLARFRNGDTQAGLQLMKRQHTWGTFNPAVRFPTLERAVESYMHVKKKNRGEVAGELAQAARDADAIVVVLTLCGYLAWSELAQTAWDVWGALDAAGQQATLVPLVWALTRCADETMQDKLEEALLRARAWSDEDRVEGNINHASQRHNYFVAPLRFALRWEMTPASTETWARVASEQEDMRETFLYLLRGIDQPATVEAYVRLTSKFGGSWADNLAAQRHPGDGDRDLRERLPITAASRERLWQMIEGGEPEDTRKVAFWLWKRFPVPEDVERLRRIKEDDPLFDEAFQVRLRLRDHTAAPRLIELMNEKPGAWCSFAYAIYHEEGIADALFNNLETALASDPVQKQYVERLPRYLPPKGVKRLVREKRELLLKSPGMWNPLWRSNVPEALGFLQESLPQADREDLRYMFLLSGNSYPVSERMLNAILPVIQFFSDEDQEQLAFVILNAGRTDWAEAHGIKRVISTFKGELTLWLNEDDAIVTLNEAASAVAQGVEQVERIDHFYEIKRRSNEISFDVRAVLKRWLGPSPEPNKLIVAGMLLSSLGTGDDIEWWEALEPDKGGTSYETWSNTFYLLRRRRWQRHD